MFTRFRSLALIAAFSVLIAPTPRAFAQMTMPFVRKTLYSETANPRADIAAALKKARAEKKRVILDFGGNWCGDCLILDMNMHQEPNGKVLEKHFIVVHVDIGHMDHNMDIATRYKVPVTKGVPALAVLDSNGKLLYSEKEKEFEYATLSEVTKFLNRWKE
ncbi:MAG TPA: thioredoxin family protein [Edaphobacter sp.]|jgi:thiol:disulfide interchange protein|nr:thioredoxin family protein [Edaphobacter sp.]